MKLKKFRKLYCNSCDGESEGCKFLNKLNQQTEIICDDGSETNCFEACTEIWDSNCDRFVQPKNNNCEYLKDVNNCLSCSRLKDHSDKEIQDLISDFDEDDENEEYVDVNLTNEEKIQKIKGILGIEREVEIVRDIDINAFARKGKIYVSTGALLKLDLDELAFVVAHEDSHLESNHFQKKEEFAREISHEIIETWSSKDGFIKKIFNTAKIGVVGFVADIALGHSLEIEADIKAKQKLKEAGFGEDGGEKFFNRINSGFSRSHPSSELRKNIIDKI